MAIRILFDSNHRPIMPTMLLSSKSGKCYGMINNGYGLNFEDSFNDTPNFSLKVSKYDNGIKCNVWDNITDFKLIYCVEWDAWFEIKVELDDGQDIIKTITGYGLGEAETSQILLNDIQINTEDDIARDDYVPTTIYNEDNPKASLLNRLIDEKAPHYKIGHVDYSLRNIQRVFEFDDISIQEALINIGTEIGALVVFDNSNDMLDSYHSKPKREISLYDLKNVCKECGERFDISHTCPKCGSAEYTKPYGKDTPIFVSKDNFTDDIIYTTDADSVKNCFRLIAGDDLMTATIKNCNPNGSQYIWYISDEMKSDMPDELVEKLNAYNEMYDLYRKDNVVELNEYHVSKYNELVNKYRAFDKEIPYIEKSITGYSNLMKSVYNTIDFNLYLSNVLMEAFKPTSTSAALESTKLNSTNLSPVAVSNVDYISDATADSCVLEMARVLIDARYRVKIISSSFDKDTRTWHGSFSVTNYSNDEDTADSNECIVVIGDDYEKYITQKIEKVMAKCDTSEYSVSTVMKQELIYTDGEFSGAFVESLRKYSMMMLSVIHDCCQGCIDVLIEQGIGNRSDQISSDMYDTFYQKYYRRLQAIEHEQSLREDEISMIENVKDNILDERDKIQSALDFESYLGSDLWKIFCGYRRDDKYENNNFISDGLSNAELFQNALEFIENAEKEIIKSATTQHSISSTLYNFLNVKGFERLAEYFETGNWIRIEVDGSIYKLRLLKYNIDFENPDYLEVEFSDVEKYRDGTTDVKSILDQASSMASSYSYVSRQSSKGKDAFNTIDGWTNEGMSLTATKIMNDAFNQDIVWDSHGMLFRKRDSISGDFEPIQLKIVTNTLAITDDYWETVKTAIGKFLYKNPRTGEIESAYGVNAETIVGTVILGEKLGIYNSTGTMSFDLNGFSVRNDKNEVLINPSADSIFTIKNGETDVLSFDANGNGTFTGNIVATSLELKPDVKIKQESVDGLDDALSEIENKIDSTKTFKVVLSNEYQVVSNYSSSIEVSTETSAYYGSENVTDQCKWSIAVGGCSVRKDGNVYYLTGLSADNAYVTFTANYTDSNGKQLKAIKQFRICKIKDGIDGISIESIIEYYLAINENTGITTSTSGWTTEPQPISKDKKYLWNYEVISFNRGDDQVTEPKIVGIFGEDGVGIDHIVKKYLATEQSENVTTSTDGWSETPQVITPEKRFLWFYEETHFTDSNISATDPYIIGVYGTQGLQGIQGERGENGIPGTNGTDGKTSYFHIKYSSVASPTSSAQMSETPNIYIGTYVDYVESDSTDPSKYTWSKFQGSDGKDGIPGTNGTDGKTSYLHIKYSNDGGQTFTSNSGEDVGDYIGQYVDFTQADSNNVSDYTWKKIVGENGIDGKDGVTYYTWIKYADDENGTNMSDNPSGKEFIGIAYNKATSQKGINANEYAWSKFVGSDGIPGTNGADGKTYYTWVKYADDENGTNMSDDPIGKDYIGLAFNKESQQESSNASDYKWNKYVGADGIPGENAKTWRMDLSDLLIVQQSDFSVSPTSIHASTYEIDDSGAHEYQGKIKISISTDGSTWSVVDNTTSSVYTYILPNTYQYKYVKFELFSNDDFLLDVQTITVNHDIATIFDELSEKIESSAVNITETTDENGHTIKNVSVGTGTGQKQFSVIDTSDFIYTDIAIGSKDVADAEEAYGAGKSFLKISKDGLIQASNALIYGTVYASGGKFTDVQGVNIDISGNSSFGGANGIKISNGKVVLGSDVDLSFLNGTTFLTKDSLRTDSLTANNLTISGNSIFSGTLSGADGTFTGTLSGVNGTFSGTLSGATGSFNGVVTARSFCAWDSINLKTRDLSTNQEVETEFIKYYHDYDYEDSSSSLEFLDEVHINANNMLRFSSPYMQISGDSFSIDCAIKTDEKRLVSFSCSTNGIEIIDYSGEWNNPKYNNVIINGSNVITSGNFSANTNYATPYFAVGVSNYYNDVCLNALSSNSNGGAGLWSNYHSKWIIKTDNSGAISIGNSNDYSTLTIAGKKLSELGGSSGTGVSSMSQVVSSTASGGKNTWRATLTNGNTYDFYVYNGAKGEKGDTGATGATGATGPAWNGGTVSTIKVTGKIKNPGMQSGTYSNTLCVNNGSTAEWAIFYKASSSLRYKDDVRELTEYDVEKLYDIPVHLFKYKDGYLQKEDERYNAIMPGFYVEEIDRIIPVAVDHRADDGLPEMWSDIIMIPLMFEMIKSNHSHIQRLESENTSLHAQLEEARNMLMQVMDRLSKLEYKI